MCDSEKTDECNNTIECNAYILLCIVKSRNHHLIGHVHRRWTAVEARHVDGVLNATENLKQKLVYF